MSFFFSDALEAENKQTTIPIHTARELGCKICPLKKTKARHPDMPPEGNEQPLVYFLGEAPGKDEDDRGQPFVGVSGQLLRSKIPDELKSDCRFNNVVRTHPPKNRDPAPIEIECCRNSIEADIEKSKPFVIVAVGAVPLRWLVEGAEISKWRGRFFPLKIRNHVCWGYAIYHPSYILRNQRVSATGKILQNEWDHIFDFDLKTLFSQLEALGDPFYIDSGYLYRVLWSEGLKADRELEKVLGWIGEMSQSDLVSMDYETSCLRPFENNALLLTIALANDKITYAFPYAYPEAWSEAQLKRLKDALIKFFKSPAKKICHNVKFEMEWTGETFGRELIYTNTWHDTQAQAYVLDERRGMLNLDALVRLHFGFWLKNLSKIDRSRMLSYSLEKILPYNGLDAKWTYRIFLLQKEKLDRDAKLRKVYKKLLEISATLTSTQIRGVVLDFNAHTELMKQHQAELDEILGKINILPEIHQFKDRYKMDFNPGSPQHVKQTFDVIMELGKRLQVGGSEKTSTSEKVLSELKDEYELAGLILDYRGLVKKIGTYLEPYTGYVMPKYGRIHTNFNPYETSTGRLSSDTPNLQNLPNKTGKEIRRMITAPEGYWMVCSDYGQIEARIIGVASQDEEFCKALWEDYDVHMHWAKIIAGEYPKVIGGSHNLNDKAVMKKFRAQVKNLWVFPAFYGASPVSISKGIGVPIETVLDIFQEFWRTFRGVKRWQRWIIDRYNQLGYVETLSGRRRHAPMSMNAVLNASIQGFASDICVDAMCRLDRLGIETVMQIHDDVTCYVPDNKLEETLEIIAEQMCLVPFPFINVPISVEISAGPNWFDQEAVGTFKSTDFHKVPRKLQDFTKLYDNI